MVNKLLRNSEYYPLFLRHIRHEMVTAHPDGLFVYANAIKLISGVSSMWAGSRQAHSLYPRSQNFSIIQRFHA